MTQQDDLFLIFDGNALIHRAFHAIPPLTHQGRLVNAVYGFARVLLASLGQYQPKWVAVAFDLPGKTFRHEKFAEYKAKRVKPPQALYDQIPLIRQLVTVMGIPIMEKAGFEADDAIAAAIAQVKSQNEKVKTIIFTGDKDTFQLIDERVSVITPAKGLSQPIEYTPQKVREKLGIKPEQVVDFKSLAGDGSDNISGVPGIGEKTASELLRQFGNLEGVYERVEGVDGQERKEDQEMKVLTPAVREKLRKNKDKAFFSRELVQLRTDLDLDFHLDDCRLVDYNQEKAGKFLWELGFKSLVSRLPRAEDREKQVSLF